MISRIGMQALRRLAAARRARLNRMRVSTGLQPSKNPTIYFLTPDYREAAGGLRVIYRHVDILNAAGIDAAVLHQRRGFRCSWFENDTRIANVADTTVLKGDLLVIPEVCVSVLDNVPPGIARVIFNQNSHLTWRGTDLSVARHYRPSADLKAVVTVSEHDREALSYTFGQGSVRRVHVSIDDRLFHVPEGPRDNRIAYMPRRMAQDAHRVLQILKERGVLDGWTVVPLHNLTQSEVAAQLRTTKIYLAFTHQEGFGLPPAEAMACGNYVIGQHGFGGREFFRPEFSKPVEAADVFGFARALEDAMQAERAEPGWCQAKGQAASGYILGEYSVARERDDVVAMYGEFAGLV
ncbi:glycosyltransferase [Rhizobium sp. NPDC090275]|uniref:glycosyltransferase n=1 Tax=Rhizobium sp. NPDC090275 TaxID=3364498 RepID=UPI00383B57D1